MDIEVTQENLAKALGNVSRVASSKAGLPILDNVLLRVSGNQLFIAATNLELAASQMIGAKVVKPGSITVPAKLITEFVQNLPKEVVSLKVKDNHLSVKAGGFHSTINGVSDEEFPELPTIDEKTAHSLAIPVDIFKEAVQQTIITASNDSTRPVLTGVFWHVLEGNLFFVATDGYRLAEKKVVEYKDDLAVIIPVSTLQEALRTLTDDIDTVDILLDDIQVRFRVGDGEITSKLIDGNFPDYRSLIPSSSETTVTINKTDLGRVVKVASLFARDNGGTIEINVDSDKNSLTVGSIASEVGENSSEIMTTVVGEGGSVNLNSRYLNEALGVITQQEITFAFSGKLSPIVIRPSEQDSYMHIIMPIKS